MILEVIMRKAFSAILLVSGATLFIWGVTITPSPDSQATRFFSGAPSGASMWLILGATIAALLGVSVFFLARRSRGQDRIVRRVYAKMGNGQNRLHSLSVSQKRA
jgi:hypothetical protein